MHIEEAEKIAAVIDLKLKYELMQQKRDEWMNRAGVWQARLLETEARALKAERELRELQEQTPAQYANLQASLLDAVTALKEVKEVCVAQTTGRRSDASAILIIFGIVRDVLDGKKWREQWKES